MSKMHDSSEQKTGVIALRVADHPLPAVTSCQLACSQCAQPVWISARLLDALGGPEQVEPICTRCVPPTATISIHPVTSREVEEWLGRKRHEER